jgi:hypothetical protein
VNNCKITDVLCYEGFHKYINDVVVFHLKMATKGPKHVVNRQDKRDKDYQLRLRVYIWEVYVDIQFVLLLVFLRHIYLENSRFHAAPLSSVCCLQGSETSNLSEGTSRLNIEERRTEQTRETAVCFCLSLALFTPCHHITKGRNSYILKISKTPWSKFTSELYRPSDRRLSAK